MANTDSERPAQSGADEPVVITDKRAKQGRSGGRIAIILVVSLALLVIAHFIIQGMFFGADEIAEHEMGSPPPAQERVQP